MQADVSACYGPNTYSQVADTWSLIPTTLNATINSTLACASGTGSVSVFGTGSATWASAAAGTVSLTDIGWNWDDSYGAVGTGGPPNWSYSFIATSNGVFSMDANVVGHNNTFGLFGWAIDIVGIGAGPRGGNYNGLNPTATWTYASALIAGNPYTVSLTNNGNLNKGIGDETGDMDGYFNWRISGSADPVVTPEPGELVMLVPGLLAVVAVTRRRKKKYGAL